MPLTDGALYCCEPFFVLQSAPWAQPQPLRDFLLVQSIERASSSSFLEDLYHQTQKCFVLFPGEGASAFQRLAGPLCQHCLDQNLNSISCKAERPFLSTRTAIWKKQLSKIAFPSLWLSLGGRPLWLLYHLSFRLVVSHCAFAAGGRTIIRHSVMLAGG